MELDLCLLLWVCELKLKPYLTCPVRLLFFLLKLLFFFSSPSSITYFSCTRRHFQKVLSPRPRVKHKEKKKLNFEDFHLSSEELFLILTSKRMKVATEDTKAVSVESRDLRVLNQDGYAAHF